MKVIIHSNLADDDYAENIALMTIDRMEGTGYDRLVLNTVKRGGKGKMFLQSIGPIPFLARREIEGELRHMLLCNAEEVSDCSRLVIVDRTPEKRYKGLECEIDWMPATHVPEDKGEDAREISEYQASLGRAIAHAKEVLQKTILILDEGDNPFGWLGAIGEAFAEVYRLQSFVNHEKEACKGECDCGRRDFLDKEKDKETKE